MISWIESLYNVHLYLTYTWCLSHKERYMEVSAVVAIFFCVISSASRASVCIDTILHMICCHRPGYRPPVEYIPEGVRLQSSRPQQFGGKIQSGQPSIQTGGIDRGRNKRQTSIRGGFYDCKYIYTQKTYRCELGMYTRGATWEWFWLWCGDILNAAIHHMMYCRPPGPRFSPHFGNIDLLRFSFSNKKIW